MSRTAFMFPSTDLDTALFEANLVRVDRAQALMCEFNSSEVPTLIAESQTKRWRLETSAYYYSNAQALISQRQAV